MDFRLIISGSNTEDAMFFYPIATLAMDGTSTGDDNPIFFIVQFFGMALTWALDR